MPYVPNVWVARKCAPKLEIWTLAPFNITGMFNLLRPISGPRPLEQSSFAQSQLFAMSLRQKTRPIVPVARGGNGCRTMDSPRSIEAYARVAGKRRPQTRPFWTRALDQLKSNPDVFRV